MNVSENNYTNVYETKLTVVESKLRSISGKADLSEEEKAKETSKLEQEKKQLQKKIDTEEDAKRKEELKKLMGADEAMNRLSTVNAARASLTSSIKVTTSQYENDLARGVDGQDKKEYIEKINKKLNNFTDNIVKQMSDEEDKRDRIVIRDEDEEGGINNNKVYKGINYRRKER